MEAMQMWYMHVSGCGIDGRYACVSRLMNTHEEGHDMDTHVDRFPECRNYGEVATTRKEWRAYCMHASIP